MSHEYDWSQDNCPIPHPHPEHDDCLIPHPIDVKMINLIDWLPILQVTVENCEFSQSEETETCIR